MVPLLPSMQAASSHHLSTESRDGAQKTGRRRSSSRKISGGPFGSEGNETPLDLFI